MPIFVRQNASNWAVSTRSAPSNEAIREGCSFSLPIKSYPPRRGKDPVKNTLGLTSLPKAVHRSVWTTLVAVNSRKLSGAPA
jgi:hypothetical protein